MQLYTTHIPALLAGQVLYQNFLSNSKEYVSVPRPLEDMAGWARNKCKQNLINKEIAYFGVVSSDLVIIQQNTADDKESLLIIWDKDDSRLYWNKNDSGWQREN